MSDGQNESSKKKPRKPLTPEQKEKRKAYRKEYYQKNKERMNKQSREYGKSHKEQMNGYHRKWVAKNREKVRAQYREHYARNKDAIKAKHKAYKEKDGVRSKIKSWFLEKKYGIDITVFEEMISSQDEKCKCCGIAFGLLSGTRPCVDHCHSTGLIRGILCGQCNLLLGHAHDSQEVLRQCADYLESFEISKGGC